MMKLFFAVSTFATVALAYQLQTEEPTATPSLGQLIAAYNESGETSLTFSHNSKQKSKEKTKASTKLKIDASSWGNSVGNGEIVSYTDDEVLGVLLAIITANLENGFELLMYASSDEFDRLMFLAANLFICLDKNVVSGLMSMIDIDANGRFDYQKMDIPSIAKKFIANIFDDAQQGLDLEELEAFVVSLFVSTFASMAGSNGVWGNSDIIQAIMDSDIEISQEEAIGMVSTLYRRTNGPPTLMGMVYFMLMVTGNDDNIQCPMDQFMDPQLPGVLPVDPVGPNQAFVITLTVAFASLNYDASLWLAGADKDQRDNVVQVAELLTKCIHPTAALDILKAWDTDDDGRISLDKVADATSDSAYAAIEYFDTDPEDGHLGLPEVHRLTNYSIASVLGMFDDDSDIHLSASEFHDLFAAAASKGDSLWLMTPDEMVDYIMQYASYGADTEHVTELEFALTVLAAQGDADKFNWHDPTCDAALYSEKRIKTC